MVREFMNKKVFGGFCGLLMMITLLCGCGIGDSKNVETGITINKDMSVDAVIVSDFDESVYSVTELQEMMESEAAEHNAQNGAGTITPGTASVSEGRVTVTMTYATADDYAVFNDRFLRAESLENILSGGAPSVAIKDIKTGESVDVTTLNNPDKLIMVVTDEPGVIKLPGKAVYVSDGVETMTKSSVRVSEDMDGLAYIIYRN